MNNFLTNSNIVLIFRSWILQHKFKHHLFNYAQMDKHFVWMLLGTRAKYLKIKPQEKQHIMYDQRKTATRDKIMTTFKDPPFYKFIFTFRCLTSHWFIKPAKCFWVGKIKILTLIIRKDPWEYWILGKITITTSSQCVKMHEVLEIAYFSILPPLWKRFCHCLEKTATLIAFLFWWSWNSFVQPDTVQID